MDIISKVIRRAGLVFTYYPESRGVVVTRRSIPIDAGPLKYHGDTPTQKDFERWVATWIFSDTVRPSPSPKERTQ